MKVGISACLLGNLCTYKGGHNKVAALDHLTNVTFVPICPEVMGGLSTPRPPAEIITQDPLKVVNNQGIDVTEAYLKGSYESLKLLLDEDVQVALLKRRSPSCGCDGIYDGTFSHIIVSGQGVCARILNENGIKTFHEDDLEMFLKYIGEEED